MKKALVSFLSELYHYDENSFRFYSPKLEDFNLLNASKCILANIK